MSIDPHRKYYPFIIWVAITPSNKFVVYNEFPTRSMMGGKFYDEIRNKVALDITPQQLAGIIHVLDCGQYGANVIKRVIDPRFADDSPEYVAQLSQHKVVGWVYPQHESIDAGRERIRQLIEYNVTMGYISGYNEPAMVVMSHCENVNRALLNHSWEAKDKKISGDGVECERFKDPIDTERYLTNVIDCKWIDNTPKKPAAINPQYDYNETDIFAGMKSASLV